MLEFQLKKHKGRLITISIWFTVSFAVFVLVIFGMIVKFKWNYLIVFAASIVGIGYYGYFALGFWFENAKTISFYMNKERLHWIAKDKAGNKVYENSVGLEQTAYVEIAEYRTKIMNDRYLNLLDARKNTIREQEFYNEFYALSQKEWQEVILLIVNSVERINAYNPSQFDTKQKL
ncbi:MAG: hypothetical protein IM638_09620 [Bacteroidetes bacterium]|nr:hypothetical protein [Bacteroidota bacterium]